MPQYIVTTYQQIAVMVQLLMLTATPQVLSQRTGLMFLVDQNIAVGKCPNDGAIFLGNGLSSPLS